MNGGKCTEQRNRQSERICL